MRREDLLAVDRVDLREEDVGVAGAVRVERRDERGRGGEDEGGDDPGGTVVAADERRDAGPDAVPRDVDGVVGAGRRGGGRGLGVTGAGGGLDGARDPRPEHPAGAAAADEQQGGQERERGDERRDDADGRDGAEERFEDRSDSSRHSRPATTVPALAAIGSQDALIARRMAVHGDASAVSSSR